MSYQPKVYREQGGDKMVVASGGSVEVNTGGDITINGVSVVDEVAALAGLTSDAAELDAAVAGTPLVFRTNVTAAQVNAGVTPVVPAVAGKRFQVLHIAMAAAGGNVSGPTTVEVVEETAGTVFLSHVTADLTSGVWHNLITGTPVITGITAGGMTSADNKALIVTKSGGTDFATATGLDVIVVGYYTTT